MIGILVVAHGALAEELTNSVAMILGRIPLLGGVGLRGDQGLDELRQEIRQAWQTLERGGADQLLILVDMFGGSCSNVAARLASEYDAHSVAVLTGVSLPMVLEAAIDRDLYTLEELAAKIVDAGRKSIVDVRAVMAEKMR